MTAGDLPRAGLTLRRKIDLTRDHARGGGNEGRTLNIVVYGDYLCPFCRRLRTVLEELHLELGNSLVYVFRHLPNERAHPGAGLAARASEAAAAQGQFWQMHDLLYEQEPPISTPQVFALAQHLGLDAARFKQDLDGEVTRARVEEDLGEGHSNGVTVTPTIFVNNQRYDDAWDFHSILEALRRPLAAQVRMSARAFADLPASGGATLLLAAVAALICANTGVAPYYRAMMKSSLAVGLAGRGVDMALAEWFSQGLLAVFFLLVGLEIRRELTSGALTNPKAAVLPVLAAIGGVIVPAIIYLSLATPAARAGWSVPTATDVAFTIGILALLGQRVPSALRVFVATLAVVDDILSVLTLAIFYPLSFVPAWLPVSALATLLLLLLNRSRVYAAWPYVTVALGLWLGLHASGIHASLAGVILALFLPTRPAPAAGPLLGQAATALAAIENAERDFRSDGAISSIQQTQIWEAAIRNLTAATARLLSPADRIERAVAPWSAYLILPLFAFSATGVVLSFEVQSADEMRVFAGVILGLVFGKPIGVLLASWVAIKTRVGIAPQGTTVRAFIGAACLCGVGDTVALLMSDQAFPQSALADAAKLSVLMGSILAAALGSMILVGASKRAAH